MKKIFSLNVKDVFILLFCLLIYNCKNEDNPVDIHWERNFVVDLQVITEGFDGKQTWFQPRVAWTGNSGEFSLIMQPWYISASDYFGTYHEMLSQDGGKTWNGPTLLDTSLGDRFKGDTLVRIADVNSQYHSKSNTILAVGGVCEYLDGKDLGMVKNTCYFTYDNNTRRYNAYKILEKPSDKLFSYSYPGCSQWVELDNGDILQPFRMWDAAKGQFYCTVARCTFDGENLAFKEYGNILRLNRGRGLYEPSLVEYNGKYYLTLRNDINGQLSVSSDGLHYSEPIEWRFDTGALVNSENTQQHWVKSPWALYLVYTSSKRPESEGVLRGRAPLFIAEFDEKRMCLIKATERMLVPNTGAQLGNFGTLDLDESNSWVVTSEATTADTQFIGDNNARVYIAKIHWF